MWSKPSCGQSRPAISTGACGSWRTPMPRAREARLARLTAAAARVGSAKGLDRCALRAWVTVCANISDGLAQAGIDPARARALRLGEAAAAQLAGLSDTA